MQKDELGIGGLAGFAKEDVEPVNVDGSGSHRGLGDVRDVMHSALLCLGGTGGGLRVNGVDALHGHFLHFQRVWSSGQ